MRNCYVRNPSELCKLDEFKQNCLSADKNPIREYTKDSFLYRCVNHVLRQQNIPAAFLFGFFLRDLYQQLKHEYGKRIQKHMKDLVIKVYRGQ